MQNMAIHHFYFIKRNGPCCLFFRHKAVFWMPKGVKIYLLPREQNVEVVGCCGYPDTLCMQIHCSQFIWVRFGGHIVRLCKYLCSCAWLCRRCGTTVSWNHLGWKRPVKSLSPTINLALPNPPRHHISKCAYTDIRFLFYFQLKTRPTFPLTVIMADWNGTYICTRWF